MITTAEYVTTLRLNCSVHLSGAKESQRQNALGRVAHNCQRSSCKWEQTEIETSDIETGEQFKERMKRSRVTQGITTGFHRLGKYLKTPEQI